MQKVQMEQVAPGTRQTSIDSDWTDADALSVLIFLETSNHILGQSGHALHEFKNDISRVSYKLICSD